MSVVLIFVLVADPTSESAASAIAASTADARDDKTSVQLERVSMLPSDAEALRRGVDVGAEDVFEVSWPGADRAVAHVHAHLRTKPAWVDRELAFEAKSPSWERGRAVGLAIASMLPDAPPAELPAPTAVEAAPPTEPAPPVAIPALAAAPAPIAVTPEIQAPKPTVDVAPTKPLARPAYALGLAFEWMPPAAAVGATSGGALDFAARLGDRIEARAAVRARLSSIAAIATRTAQLEAGGGIAATIFATSAVRFEVGAELRLARASATRTNDIGVTESAARFTPVGAISIGASFPLSASLAAFFGVGGEVPFGQTTITINGESEAELPRFSVVGDAGARWRF